MKTYVITLSQAFLKGHPHAGEPTYFADKFLKGQGRYECELSDEWGVWAAHLVPKIHTIRGNYELWAGRIKEVQEGKAVLSIRLWSGKPYNSKQITLATLTAGHGVGVQKVEFTATTPIIDGIRKDMDLDMMAYNDGLTYADFIDWFKKYDLTEPMAIVHFTAFRYSTAHGHKE